MEANSFTNSKSSNMEDVIILQRCYFCGNTAPSMTKSKGKYKLECGCGNSIEDYDFDMVVGLWNYHVDGYGNK